MDLSSSFEYVLKNPIHLTHLLLVCFFIAIALMSWSDYCYGLWGGLKSFAGNDDVEICKPEDRSDLDAARVSFFTLTAALAVLVAFCYMVNAMYPSLFNLGSNQVVAAFGRRKFYR